jgi:amino acid adenylation domain-containing protein
MFVNRPEDSISAEHPLTPMQRGMLFHSVLAPESGGYIQQVVIRMEAVADECAFRRTWNEAIRRHRVLGGRFQWHGNSDARFVIHGIPELPWAVEDLSRMTELDRDQRLARFLEEDRRRGFDLTQAPLLRAMTFRLSADAAAFVLTFHHILLDGRSLRVLLKEVFGIYEAHLRGETKTVEIGSAFADYVEFLQRRDRDADRAFWTRKLAGFRVANEFPGWLNPAKGPRRTLETKEATLVLSREFSDSLRAHATSIQVSLNNVFQAAWAFLVQMYSRDDDVVFGVVRSCRSSGLPAGEGAIGLLINTVPLRISLQPQLPWAEFLRAVRAAWQELRPYEHAALEDIEAWSEVRPGASLFGSILMFENYQLAEDLRRDDVSWAERGVSLLERTNFPLTMSVYAGDRIQLKLEFDSQRGHKGWADRVLRRFRWILEQARAEPAQRLCQLSLVPPEERSELLARSAGPVRPEYQSLSYLERFEAQVARSPEAVAVVSGEDSLTYRAMDLRSNQLARHLAKLGVRSEVRVGVYLERGIDTGVILLAVWKAGGAFVPLDPASPAARSEYQILDCGAPVLVTQSALLGSLPAYSGTKIVIDRDWQQISAEPTEPLGLPSDPYRLAYVIYTSGTTGNPKGVELLHRGLLNHNLFMVDCWALTPADRVLQVCSLSFDVSLEEMFPTWLAGATLVVAPRGRILPDRLFTALIREQRISLLDLSTAFWQEWVLELARSGEALPGSVRLVIVGGEKSSPASVARWRQLAGPEVRWIDCYGPTEATIGVTLFEPDVKAGADKPRGGESIGRPIANSFMRIVDRWDRLVPVGVPGELLIGGVGLARGYLNSPEKTQRAFIEIPLAGQQSERLYRSGDLVRCLEDGNLEFLGRIDSQVKLRGYRIELGEIEARLTQITGVHQAVVRLREFDGEQHLVAYVMPAGIPLRSEVLKADLERSLPAYMVPSFWVMLDRLPMTTGGKIDDDALPAPSAQPERIGRLPEGPTRELETQLRQIWMETLGKRHIAFDDDFFSLGGHSLLAVRLVSRIQSRLGWNLPLATLFSAPTIAQMASWIREQGNVRSWSSLVPIQPLGSRLPFFCVHAAGGNVLFYRDLAHALGSDQPFYGLQVERTAAGLPMKRSFEQMAERYITEMRLVQPRGPYYLGGASYGGVIAWEMAQQLVQRGETVGLLALLDTHGPSYPRYPASLGTLQIHWLKGLRRFQLHALNLRLLPGSSRLRYVRTKCQQLILQLRRLRLPRLRLFGETGSGSAPEPTGFEEADSMQDWIQVAYDNYVVKPYPGRATLFRAIHQPLGAIPDDHLGWKPYTPHGMEIVPVVGFHGSLVVEPCVGGLARELSKRLAAAGSRDEWTLGEAGLRS